MNKTAKALAVHNRRYRKLVATLVHGEVNGLNGVYDHNAFCEAWDILAQRGRVDIRGGLEYRNTFIDWYGCGCPEDCKGFILGVC